MESHNVGKLGRGTHLIGNSALLMLHLWLLMTEGPSLKEHYNITRSE